MYGRFIRIFETVSLNLPEVATFEEFHRYILQVSSIHRIFKTDGLNPPEMAPFEEFHRYLFKIPEDPKTPLF